MSSSLLHMFGMFDDDDEDDDDIMETQPRNYSNHGVVAPPRRNAKQPPNHGVVAPPRRNAPQPRASLNNTGTQNLRGLINNTGYTKGNGVGVGEGDREGA
ncbi:hypothetical protein Lalb_Chr08g0234451 [Lupinus albus]|uniref:Uncharacterized protein n=1 Tax=Lupinus albus TaxID=3870 RepID=A0A6A4Q3B0_LUPAL|nr:hypothetical protein Lalb_Chr08g0234451 [Lupinus albus]